MRDSKLPIGMGLMTALVSLSVGLMRDSRAILVIGLLIVVASLAGCAGKIRYPSYYVLNLPAPVAATANSPSPILGSVAVREFAAPRFLREGPIAYRESPEQLDFYDYHRWAEDPRRAATRALVDEIRARGMFRSVDIYDGHGSPECLLTGTLDHLEELDGSSGVSTEVSLTARLVDLKSGEVLWQDTLSKTSKVDQRSVPGIVAEISRDLANVV